MLVIALALVVWAREVLTRQTTVPHRRHSPTMSLAQAPNFPLVNLGILIPAGPRVIHVSSSSAPDPGSRDAAVTSDTHRNVCGINCLRC